MSKNGGNGNLKENIKQKICVFRVIFLWLEQFSIDKLTNYDETQDSKAKIDYLTNPKMGEN